MLVMEGVGTSSLKSVFVSDSDDDSDSEELLRISMMGVDLFFCCCCCQFCCHCYCQYYQYCQD